MTGLIESVFMLAMSLSGYGDPQQRPDVEAISAQALSERLCDGQACPALAYYDHNSQTIYHDARLNVSESVSAQGFIVHEMVHFLQHQHGVMADASSCESRLELELEAYSAQGEFLRQHGATDREVRQAMRLLSTLCEADEVPR